MALLQGARLPKRPAQPAPQGAGAGPRVREVEYVDKSPSALVLEMPKDLQVSQRRVIHDHATVVVLNLETRYVIDLRSGGAARVVQHEGGGGHRGLALHQTEAAQVVDLELPAQGALRGGRARRLRTVDRRVRNSCTVDPGRKLTGRIGASPVEVRSARENRR